MRIATQLGKPGLHQHRCPERAYAASTFEGRGNKNLKNPERAEKGAGCLGLTKSIETGGNGYNLFSLEAIQKTSKYP